MQAVAVQSRNMGICSRFREGLPSNFLLAVAPIAAIVLCSGIGLEGGLHRAKAPRGQKPSEPNPVLMVMDPIGAVRKDEQVES